MNTETLSHACGSVRVSFTKKANELGFGSTAEALCFAFNIDDSADDDDAAFDSAFETLSKRMFGRYAVVSCSWNQEDDILTFGDLDDGAVRDLYGYDLAEDAELPSGKAISDYIEELALRFCLKRLKKNP